nr:hypothetical protein [Tanacetum cinerariifolium]
MYHSEVSASLAWSSEIHQRPPHKDEHVLPTEEQLLPLVVSPTAESPEYVAESDPEEDPKEDDADNEDEDEEEEEHIAPADSAIVIPTDELVSLPEGTEHVIPPPSTDTTTTRARITIRLQAAISFPSEAEVERLLAMPTSSPSPLTSLSPPSAGERLARCTTPAASPSPLLVSSPLLPSSGYTTQIQTLRDDVPKIKMPPRKRLCLSEESFTARPTRDRGIDYGFVSTLDAEVRRRGIG